MLWDNHMHSNFSGDSDASPIDMINTAKSKGLLGMTFTDHLDLDYPAEFGFFDLDIENYYPAQHKLAQENSDDSFTVLTGLEVGIQPHIVERCSQIVNDHPYDFIIGSTHLVDKYDPYFDGFWDRGETNTLLKRYYECILENITAFNDFDSLGHLDYIFRYVKNPELKKDTHQPYFEIVDAILSKIIALDKAIEVNTGGLRGNRLPNPNPSPSIIKRYHELGGKLITLGADAHTPKDIAFAFDIVPDLLKDCGFKEFVVYKNRKPEAYPL
ncbi:MAG: histidinol-phosphatase HisJ family protein [Pseudobutyrivibrio sp.]|nr:histidinol-phosphatase HisJ family protein [Pseudobutyrivibrio sp.]